jgi:hypothetical protein
LGLAAAALVVTRFGPKSLAARGLTRLGLFDLLRKPLERGRR